MDRTGKIPSDPMVGSDIAVTVIGGYLGAGKTTLVNHILRTADERVAVLVNDFGDVNIDAELIESEDGDTISLTNGCICCSLVDGFAAALTTIKELDPLPQRLVIEASGVGDPAMIAAYGHSPGLRLDAVVVVVDTETVRQRAKDRYVGDTVLGQLRSADIMVVNKVDLVSTADVAATTAWLQATAPEAVIVEAVQAQVAPELLFGAVESSRRQPAAQAPVGHSSDSQSHSDNSGEPDSHGHPASSHTASSHAGSSHAVSADAVFEHWFWSGDQPLGRSTIDELMEALPDSVVRAKGLIHLSDRPDRSMVLQRVGSRWTLRPGAAWTEEPRTQLVVIGTLGAIDDAWLAEQLER